MAFQLSPQPKRPQQTRRKAKAARFRRLRPITRALAWDKDQGRCVFPSCRRAVAFHAFHAHEPQGRAIDDPCDIDTVVTVCWECHAEMHVRVGGITKRIEGSRSQGLRFYARESARAEWRQLW